AEDGIRDFHVTGVQTCALPIFLLAVIAEELGFVGVAVVVGLFAWLVLRAFAIGRQAVSLERPFSALVAHGIGTWLCVQSFINMRSEERRVGKEGSTRV